ncbi:MFS transporter [Streptomyces sp. NRRL B-3229]|uniref:MFS transporter n=1 Tax=Streptomyces sp. NRRL B-3229 TaxID=1463836 RepID=UPI00068D4132|nr:MFS transporter [Streptomyces sp. NRRL B-3229]
MAVTDAQNTQQGLRADQLVKRLDQMPVSRFHARVVGTLGAGTFFDAFDIVSIATVLSAISATYGLSSSQAGLLVSAGFLGQAVGAIGFGLASERLGRRRVFLAALAVMGVFALISALAWSSTSLGAIRLIQGFGLGAEVPVASALLGEFVAARQRGRVTVLYKLASPLGNLATSLTAAALLASTSPENAWRLLFAIGGAPLLIALVAWRLLPESPRVLIRQGRFAEAERIVTAMEASARSAPAAPTADSTAAPASAPSADLAPTRHTELLSPQYRRRTLTAWVLWFTVFFTLLGATAWMPSLYVKRVGVSPSTAALLSGAVTLAAIVLIIAVGATVDRVGRRRWFLAGYVISLAGALLAVVLAATGNLHTWPALLASGGLMLLGVSSVDPLVYAWTAEIYPTRMRSWGILSASSWRGFAAVLAPTVIGALVDHGIAAVFGLFGAVLVIGLVVTAVFGIETKQTSLEELSQ